MEMVGPRIMGYKGVARNSADQFGLEIATTDATEQVKVVIKPAGCSRCLVPFG
jgi:hypothetical protein